MLVTRGTGDVSMKSLAPLTEEKTLTWSGSVGDDLQHLEKDRAIHTDPHETRRRRTIKLQREKNNWGFTLQTYGIKNKKTNELDVMTYVDYVELNGPANMAGMRKGDVILSVNGENVESITHKSLVAKVKATKGDSLRLVVLFEDCCRKVELYERFIKLKQILKMKLEEYRFLEKKENFILEGHGSFSRMSSVRSSLKSSTSSDWDRYSMVVSPAQMLQSLPTKLAVHQHFLFNRPYLNSQDDASDLSLHDAALNDSFSDESDTFLSLSASCSDIISLPGLRKNKESSKSISSLITHYDGPLRDVDKEYSSDADTSQTDSLSAGVLTKGDNSLTDSIPRDEVPLADDSLTDSLQTREVGNGDNSPPINQSYGIVKPEDVVFTFDIGDKSSDVSASDNAEVKLVETIEQNRADELETEDQSKCTAVDTDHVPVSMDKEQSNNLSFISPEEDNSSDEESSPNKESSKSPGRFVNGIRVNDDDQITKL